MTKDQIYAVLERIRTWPEHRQLELAELALEMEAELAGTGYRATPDELAAIDEGLAGEAVSEEDVKAAFALFRKACPKGMRVEYSRRAIADLRHIAAYYARSGNPAVAERIAARIREVVAHIAGAPLSRRGHAKTGRSRRASGQLSL